MDAYEPSVEDVLADKKRATDYLRAQLAAVTAQRDELLHRARQTVWQGITCGKPYQLIPGEPLRAQLILLGELCGAIEEARAQPEQPKKLTTHADLRARGIKNHDEGRVCFTCGGDVPSGFRHEHGPNVCAIPKLCGVEIDGVVVDEPLQPEQPKKPKEADHG